MKAIQITKFGGPEVLELVELADPIPSESEELIEVSCIGINYADTHQTENSYLSKQELPLIPGLEVVGKTESGRRVLASASSGGYAQKVVANKAMCVDIPDSVSDGQAVAMLVQGTTAWHILKTMAHVKPGETVVVQAAAGGVGSIAIQLAKMWGAKVIAVTSSDAKNELAKSLGADAVVDANSTDLTAAMMAANGGKKVNIVLEMVGGKTFDASLEVLAPFGRLITYGMASRTAPTPIHPGALMGGTKTVSGFWLAHCFGKKELMEDVLTELFALISSGALKPVIGATYGLSQAKAAHEAMLTRATTGKVTLDPAR
jgi:NADPH2:quinone reductase